MVTMQKNLKLEVLGSLQLVAGIILVLLWSFYSAEWWSAALGFLAVFFLIEAIWHYIVCDCLRHFKKAD
jgi:hypothetical protein